MNTYHFEEIVVNNKATAAERILEIMESPIEFQEIWIRTGTLKCCILSNPESAWIMVTRHEEDAGFSSRNPDINATDDGRVHFRLKNGQVDGYPVNWTFQKKSVFSAAVEFIRTGRFPGGIHWQNDSGDGKGRPED